MVENRGETGGELGTNRWQHLVLAALRPALDAGGIEAVARDAPRPRRLGAAQLRVDWRQARKRR